MHMLNVIKTAPVNLHQFVQRPQLVYIDHGVIFRTADSWIRPKYFCTDKLLKAAHFYFSSGKTFWHETRPLTLCKLFVMQINEISLGSPQRSIFSEWEWRCGCCVLRSRPKDAMKFFEKSRLNIIARWDVRLDFNWMVVLNETYRYSMAILFNKISLAYLGSFTGPSPVICNIVFKLDMKNNSMWKMSSIAWI